MECDKLQSVVSRLEKVADKLESISVKDDNNQENTQMVDEFLHILQGPVAQFVQLSSNISPDVSEASKIMRTGFTLTLEFLKIVSTSKKPSDQKLMELLKPLTVCIEEIQAFSKNCFKSEFKTHIGAISEFSTCFQWVVAPGKPHIFIESTIESGVYYSNRVISSFKDKQGSADHKIWVQSLNKCFDELKEYCKSYHLMGISWNVKGVDVGTAAKPISKAAVPEKPDSSLRPAPGDLFSSINKGAGITTGLKKVDDTMKTHKNPQLRASAVVPDTEKTKPQIATKPTIIASKPALMELRDKKWIVENQTDQKMLEISECDKSYTVYMYNCVKTNLIVHGKMNTVAIDKCSNCSVQIKGGVISSVETTNSKKINIQADDVIPLMNISSSDNIQVYLNEKSKEARVSTSLASSVNVCLCQPNADLIEYPVPEQLISYIEGEKLITKMSENI